jgi:pantoate--beta-alanine ligase
MNTLRTRNELRAALRSAGSGLEVGLVPTMGALHAGHLALFAAARAECDIVVATIFVNPAQFSPDEDFGTYPRDEASDARTAEAAGVDYLFVPPVDEMYPDGFQTWVEVERFAQGLEGDARPGHFRGVATVCLKLFNIVRPRRAYFGQKDAQQAAVVEQLVRDLDLDVQIRVIATVRDEDGVAVSSRNAYLSEEERSAARALPRSLLAGEEAYTHGVDPVVAARVALSTEPKLTLEYVEVARFNGRLHLVAAARVGRTRLIDNVLLEGDLA